MSLSGAKMPSLSDKIGLQAEKLRLQKEKQDEKKKLLIKKESQKD